MKAHKVFEYLEGFVIVMPYYPQGSLATRILNPTELKNAIRQILEALHHLHEGGYIHRDIKPGNVLVANLEGERLHLVVADYGLMTWENPVTFCGTPGYIAPEIFHNANICDESKKHQYLDKVDIYALGILILRMLGISIPQNLIDTQKEFTKLVKLLIAKESDKCEKYDSERIDLLNVADRMLQYAPIIRPSADECLRLPCLDRATATPAAIQWPSPSSTIKSVASAPVNPARKDEWGSIVVGDRFKRGGETKKRRPLSPAPTTHKLKVQKTQHHPLPTPRTTPQKHYKARMSEDAEMATDAPLLSWDKMPISD